MRIVTLTALGLVAGLSLVGAQAANADDTQVNQNRYSLTADGDGMTVDVYEPSLPATDRIGSSAYSAHAQANSQGNSSSFAGLPYLGAFLETLPGTVNGLSGGATPPIPPFPGYVVSRYPTPLSAKQSQGPYLITADSDATSSHSLSGFGLSGSAASTEQQVFSTASVSANPDGSTSSVSTAGVRALQLGPLRILTIASKGSIEDPGTGAAPKVLSTTDLGTIEVLGFKLGVDQDGFHVLGAPVALPYKDVLDKVNAALAQSGMEITVLPSSRVTDKVSGVLTVASAALRVTWAGDVPAQGPTKVIYTFGRATVGSVDAGTGLVDLPVDLPVVDGGAPVTDAPADGGVATAPLLPVDGAPAPADMPAPMVDVPSTGGDGSAQAAPKTLGLVPTSAPTSSSTSSTYLVLALASLVVVCGQQLFSRFGIHLLLRRGA